MTTRNFYKELTKKVFGAIANILGTAGTTYLVCTVIGTCIGGIPGTIIGFLIAIIINCFIGSLSEIIGKQKNYYSFLK